MIKQYKRTVTKSIIFTQVTGICIKQNDNEKYFGFIHNEINGHYTQSEIERLYNKSNTCVIVKGYIVKQYQLSENDFLKYGYKVVALSQDY